MDSNADSSGLLACRRRGSARLSFVLVRAHTHTHTSDHTCTQAHTRTHTGRVPIFTLGLFLSLFDISLSRCVSYAHVPCNLPVSYWAPADWVYGTDQLSPDTYRYSDPMTIPEEDILCSVLRDMFAKARKGRAARDELREQMLCLGVHIR